MNTRWRDAATRPVFFPPPSPLPGPLRRKLRAAAPSPQTSSAPRHIAQGGEGDTRMDIALLLKPQLKKKDTMLRVISKLQDEQCFRMFTTFSKLEMKNIVIFFYVTGTFNSLCRRTSAYGSSNGGRVRPGGREPLSLASGGPGPRHGPRPTAPDRCDIAPTSFHPQGPRAPESP